MAGCGKTAHKHTRKGRWQRLQDIRFMPGFYALYVCDGACDKYQVN
jgi:hypothetical protein